MKRDFDLIRMILKDIEDLPPGASVGGFEYDDIDGDTIAAHAVLLLDAGLIQGTTLPIMSGRPKIRITGLTWAGHDFLAVAKNDTIWDKAKKSVLAPAAGATWTVVLEWLKAESMKSFGLA